MLIAGFTLVFHVNMCDKPVIQVDVVGPLDFPQQFRKKPKFPVTLAKHELWRCFPVGAAHVLCKAGTFIHPLQSASQKDKNGGHYYTFWLEKGSRCITEIA